VRRRDVNELRGGRCDQLAANKVLQRRRH
jgi:hypothetical protein